MPTKHPRYTVTDSGDAARMLDRAQQEWPGENDRRKLLMALLERGAQALDADSGRRDRRLEAQREALRAGSRLLDHRRLDADRPWR